MPIKSSKTESISPSDAPAPSGRSSRAAGYSGSAVSDQPVLLGPRDPSLLPEAAPLKGLRRELTRERFEELAAVQCRVPEILGYAGITEQKLARWVRKIYRRSLADTMEMLRQDGLIEIRRASFELLKKSAPLIQQQFNRFLTVQAGADEDAKRLAREIFSLDGLDEEAPQGPDA